MYNILSRQLEREASFFMIAAHDAIGQRRKYTNVAYWTHPVAVTAIVKTVTDDENILAAALLHDVVEDTAVTVDTLEQLFNPTVAALVAAVTKVSKSSDGNRAARLELERQHLAKASNDAKTIKLADILDNLSNIVSLDPDFARIYIQEKQRLLPSLEGGHPELFKKVQTFITQYFNASL